MKILESTNFDAIMQRAKSNPHSDNLLQTFQLKDLEEKHCFINIDTNHACSWSNTIKKDENYQ